jgi:hypothetical protein
MLVSIGNWALCDGTRAGGVGVTKLKFRVERLIQVQQIFRANQVLTLDRGNRKTTITFDVIQTFPTQDDADEFILTQETNIPSSGIVKLTAVKPNGQKVVRYLPGGKLGSHELVEQIGVTTRYQYVLVGGIIQTAVPAE